MDELRTFLLAHKLQVLVSVVGLLMIGVGIWQAVALSQGNEVEIVETGESQEASVATVVVDVAGAVEKPGVYKMNADARVADALVAAGGISAEADRSYLARFVNQAQVLQDGMKIYIPLQGAEPSQPAGEATQVLGESGDVAGSSLVNVNTASVSELDSLWGIGAARAQQIVDNRPYSSLEELKSKAGIPQNVLDANEGKMSVY